tara:strand:- start:1662 stop:2681 length:1020 start_codon:yes stop_codon:yes gene_type:complete
MNLQTLIGSEELTQFYKNKFYFSYSSINKLLFSPRSFYSHYVLNQREDSIDPHLVGGRVLHCLLLEPENFEKDFILMPDKFPTDSNRILIDNIFKNYLSIENNTLLLEEFQKEILTDLLNSNLYQTLKTDQQRLDKILTDQNKNYFEFLKTKQNKALVDPIIYANCIETVAMLKSNKDVRALLYLDKEISDDHITVFNELPLKHNVNNLPFGYKGILDNVVIDTESKTIFISDLKTTGKGLLDFPDTVKYYKYWIQASMYYHLVYEEYIKPMNDTKDWTIVITFIVVDKYNQIYPFQVSQESLAVWLRDFDKIIDIVKYHYENKDFTLPYELAIGNVKL